MTNARLHQAMTATRHIHRQLNCSNLPPNPKALIAVWLAYLQKSAPMHN
jgi:hypothetical protein